MQEKTPEKKTDNTTIEWEQGLAFEVSQNGHTFKVDADEQFGGTNQGPRPKALVLSALAGCTGMDVASILSKMRMPWDTFKVHVEGDLSDTHPKVYTHIRMSFEFSGKELDRTKIERAAELSYNNYCGVAAMLKPTVDISYKIVTV